MYMCNRTSVRVREDSADTGVSVELCRVLCRIWLLFFARQLHRELNLYGSRSTPSQSPDVHVLDQSRMSFVRSPASAVAVLLLLSTAAAAAAAAVDWRDPGAAPGERAAALVKLLSLDELIQQTWAPCVTPTEATS